MQTYFKGISINFRFDLRQIPRNKYIYNCIIAHHGIGYDIFTFHQNLFTIAPQILNLSSGIVELEDILSFWFSFGFQDWFGSSTEFDNEIRTKFSKLVDTIYSTPTEQLLGCPSESLAAIIALDQFPRNIYRGSGDSFKFDKKALEIARNAIRKNFNAELKEFEYYFLCLPFLHSENLEDQKISRELLKGTVGEGYSIQYYDLIAQFGRFPFRNVALNRESTSEEIEYLKNYKK